MAKKLAFQQIEWNGGAIQLYEWPPAPRAEIVNRPRDQLLAGAGLSLDKNSGIRRRDLLDLFEHGFQSRAFANDLLESARISVLIDGPKSYDCCHKKPPGAGERRSV
jgi:hypothetical protein